jgi:hypothetical protein
MNNGAYFESLREYVVAHCAVEHLEVFTDQFLFDGANTPVQLIVLRRGGADNGRHVFTRESPTNGFRRTIFSENPALIAQAFEGRVTLHDLGYEAVTGTVIWNQNRDRLRTSQDEGTVPLIWAHNIADSLVLCQDHKRPQYVAVDRALRGPAIVLNRIVGAVGSGELRCALVPEGMEFVGENHVNVVRPHGLFEPRCSWERLLEGLRHPECVNRVRLLTGNTQVSATELTHLLPLDI